MAAPIYLDHHATTPCAPEVLEAMWPFFSTHFGNAHSAHAYGWAAKAAVEQAREQLAALLHTSPYELIFTSGATEANHLAVRGAIEAPASRGRHVITSAIEHSSVRVLLNTLRDRGQIELSVLPVNERGLVEAEQLAAQLRPDTVLVSVMHANNEIGTVQPLAQLSALCRAHGAWLHSDAAQTVGHLPCDVEALGVDLLSLSGHKFYGPQGVGALYVRRRNPRVHLQAQQLGGGQERGLRSGTLAVALIVGLGAAAQLAQGEQHARGQRLRALRDGLWARLSAALPELQLNGDIERRLPHNLHFSLGDLSARTLLSRLRGLALSTGSACATGRTEPSPVVWALSQDEQRALNTVRIGLGRETTAAQVEAAATQLIDAIQALRAQATG